MTPLEHAEFIITKIMSLHERIVMWCSGGKDSLTLLHLLRQWTNRVCVLFNDVDGEWPGVRENLEQCLQQWSFPDARVIHPFITYDEYVARYGYPMEIVPSVMDGTGLESPFYVGGHKVSSWVHCTVQRFVLPLLAASVELKADAVVTGSRASDAPAFGRMGAILDSRANSGFIRYNPLIQWTADEVYAYIDTHGIPLPPHYAWKRKATYDVPDCMACTWFPQHWAVLKARYPAVYAAHWPKVAPVYAAVAQHLTDYQASLKTLPEE